MAYKALGDLTWTTFLLSSTITLLLTPSTPATLISLLSPQRANQALTSWPLHILFPLPGIPFLQITSWLTPSLYSNLFSNVTIIAKTALLTSPVWNTFSLISQPSQTRQVQVGGPPLCSPNTLTLLPT